MDRGNSNDEDSVGSPHISHISSKLLSKLKEANSKCDATKDKEPFTELQPAKDTTQRDWDDMSSTELRRQASKLLEHSSKVSCASARSPKSTERRLVERKSQITCNQVMALAHDKRPKQRSRVVEGWRRPPAPSTKDPPSLSGVESLPSQQDPPEEKEEKRSQNCGGGSNFSRTANTRGSSFSAPTPRHPHSIRDPPPMNIFNDRITALETLRKGRSNNHSEHSTDYMSRVGGGNDEDEHDDDDNDYLLEETEKEQYEKYQDELYRQHERSQQYQSSLSQWQEHHQRQPQSLSSHCQFNLTPLHKDVEMTSLRSRADEGMESDGQLNWPTRRAASSQNGRGTNTQSSGKNPLEYKGKVLAYLDDGEASSLGCGDTVKCGDTASLHRYLARNSKSGDIDSEKRSSRGAARHEEFYTPVHFHAAMGDEDDEDEEDEDEERPLCRSPQPDRPDSRPPPSLFARVEICLNHALVLACVAIGLIFVRDRTPWWKEHEQQMALQRHEDIDPMVVYNSNDDDAVHTRDHDPLHLYDKYTGHNSGDASDKDVRAGQRIANRPAVRASHHGFRDAQYEHRPMAPGVAGKGARGRDESGEETAAFFASAMRSPTKKRRKSAGGGGPMGAEPLSRDHEAVSVPASALDKSSYESNNAPAKVPHDNMSSGQPPGVQEVSSLLPPPPPPASEHVTSALDKSRVPMSHEFDDDIIKFPHEAIHEVTEESRQAETEQKPLFTKQVEAEENSLPTSVTNPAHTGPVKSSIPTSLPKVSHGTVSSERPSEPSDRSSIEQKVSDSVPVSSVDNSQSDTGIVEGGDESGVTTEIKADENPTPTKFPSSSRSSSFFNQPQSTIHHTMSEEVRSMYSDSYSMWDQSRDGIDIPVFWRVPRSASGTVEAILSFCYRIVLANADHSDDKEDLSVITVGAGADYVNVDLSRPTGIARAAALGLGAFPMRFVLSTPFLFETAAVFRNVTATGRCFTLLRHPIHRMFSLYHHYQINESSNPNTARYRGMSIDTFAEEVAENNWMVRFLANKRAGSLTWHDLELAKQILEQKCLVGLLEKAEESMKRYERLFQWNEEVSNSNEKDKCVCRALTNGNKQNEHPTYKGTAAWETLRKKNEYDCLLYEFAEKLYLQQSPLYEK